MYRGILVFLAIWTPIQGCQYLERTIPPGSSAFIDECTECRCSADNAVLQCAVKCPEVPGCVKYEQRDGHCCPTCVQSECVVDGKKLAPGEKLSYRCEDCTCMADGRLECSLRLCPKLPPCHNVINDGCCDICLDTCPVNRTLTLGQGQSIVQDCFQCICIGNALHCTPLTCPNNPKNCLAEHEDCCRLCRREPRPCVFENGRYLSGDSWEINSCEAAECKDGEIEFRRKSCNGAAGWRACTSPGEHQCCPGSCYELEENCVFNGILLDKGEIVENKSEICTCTEMDDKAILKCRDKQDPDFCVHGGASFVPGSRIPELSADVCSECICEKGGDVRCSPIECPDSQDGCFGERLANCCAICQSEELFCIVEGRRMRHGEFLQTGHSCEECQCDGVSQQLKCAPVLCKSNPEPCPYQSDESCCDSHQCNHTNTCHVDGSFILIGQSVHVGNDVICKCIGGSDLVCQDRDDLCIGVKCLPGSLNLCCQPVNERSCVFNDKVVGQGRKISMPNCRDCICGDSGSFQCAKKGCARDQLCRVNSEDSDGCCPKCERKACSLADGGVLEPGNEIIQNCTICECDASGVLNCDRLIGCPHVSCDHGILRIEPGNCCPTCFHDESLSYCETDHGPVAVGQLYKPDKCVTCTCHSNRSLTCRTEECPHLESCSVMTYEANTCCGKCTVPGCLYEGVVYSQLHTFQPSACQTCTCPRGGGTAMCEDHEPQFVCPDVSDCPEEPIMDRTTCCAVCPIPTTQQNEWEEMMIQRQDFCLLDGERLNVGDTRRKSACEFCTCESAGTLKCDTITCPEIKGCIRFSFHDHFCCPLCKAFGCSLEDTVVPAGKSIKMPDCTECSCEQPFDQLTCRPDPLCLRDDASNPGILVDTEDDSPIDPLQNLGKHENPLNILEQNTRIREERKEYCWYREQSIVKGEFLRIDDCTRCFCEGVSLDAVCTTIGCPRLSCDSPVHIPGQCCPVC